MRKLWCKKRDLYKGSILRHCVKYYDRDQKKPPVVEVITKVLMKNNLRNNSIWHNTC